MWSASMFVTTAIIGQLLVLHCLCDAIDLQLLGEQDTA